MAEMTDSHGQELPAQVIRRIEAFLGAERGLGSITQLQLRPLVADYCKKFVALDASGRPAAFVSVSPGSHPRDVLDAASAARRVAEMLGEPLSGSVLLPHFVGDISGRSYSITAYRRPLSGGRLAGRWQRLRLRPMALAWLAELVRQSARAISTVDEEVLEPLSALAAHPAVASETQRAARAALDALANGTWRPVSTIAHNDLWWGNFVHRDEPSAGALPFQIIDWGGSDVRGAPMYDLVRLTESFGMTARQAGAQIRAHCAILECSAEHSLHYLSLALGRLSRNLGEWPVSQFASTANACLRYASAALE